MHIGVDKIEVDAPKGTVSVTGNTDPYKIIVSARKAAGRHTDVVSVGPPPPPPKPADAQKKAEEQKKKAEEEKKKKKAEEANPMFHDPHTCRECQRLVVVQLDRYSRYEPNPSCSIM